MFPVQLTTSRIGNLTRLVLTLAICDDHTYTHTLVNRSQLYNIYLGSRVVVCISLTVKPMIEGLNVLLIGYQFHLL